jgi:uncharacterized membrane protein
MYLLPRFDPLRKNIALFEESYERFILAITISLSAIFYHTLLWNIGLRLDTTGLVSACMAFIFWELGALLPMTRRNWFIGLRTPWTLSDDGVWDRTNRLAARLFRVCSLLSLIGMAATSYAVILIIGPAVLAVAYATSYSYFDYKKTLRTEDSRPTDLNRKQ